MSDAALLAGGGLLVFGPGMPAGGVGQTQLLVGLVSRLGPGDVIRPSDLSPYLRDSSQGGEDRGARWFAGALSLPGGEAVAAIVLDRGDRTVHWLLRLTAEGVVRHSVEVSAPDGPYERVRLTMDGAERFVILGAAGTPPAVSGLFEAYTIALRPSGRYVHREANSAIFQFARVGQGIASRAYTVIGDWPRRADGETPPDTGLFAVMTDDLGKPQPPRVVGNSLQHGYTNGVAFDLRGGIALLAVTLPGEDEQELLWVDRTGTVVERRKVPPWAAGEPFHGVPRLDAAGCALLFDSSGPRGRVMALDRHGTVAWRLTLREEAGGELVNVTPTEDGGFVAIGEGKADDSGRRLGWVERYGRR